jgi:hypothetical protein
MGIAGYQVDDREIRTYIMVDLGLIWLEGFAVVKAVLSPRETRTGTVP